MRQRPSACYLVLGRAGRRECSTQAHLLWTKEGERSWRNLGLVPTQMSKRTTTAIRHDSEPRDRHGVHFYNGAKLGEQEATAEPITVTTPGMPMGSSGAAAISSSSRRVRRFREGLLLYLQCTWNMRTKISMCSAFHCRWAIGGMCAPVWGIQASSNSTGLLADETYLYRANEFSASNQIEIPHPKARNGECMACTGVRWGMDACL